MSLEGFQGLIAEIAASTGVAGLTADEQGYVALSFDAHVLHLQYDAQEDVVALFTRLRAVEGDRAEQIYLMLLGANLFWQGARGATFAVEPSSGAVFLMDRTSFPALRAEAAIAWIERFNETVAYWDEKIETANRGGPIDAFAEAGAAPSGGVRFDAGLSDSFIRV